MLNKSELSKKTDAELAHIQKLFGNYLERVNSVIRTRERRKQRAIRKSIRGHWFIQQNMLIHPISDVTAETDSMMHFIGTTILCTGNDVDSLLAKFNTNGDIYIRYDEVDQLRRPSKAEADEMLDAALTLGVQHAGLRKLIALPLRVELDIP